MKALIFILICGFVSCAAPKFVVVDKTTAMTDSGCLLTLTPINKRAANRFSYVKTALVDCWDYNKGDTLKLTRREFANY